MTGILDDFLRRLTAAATPCGYFAKVYYTILLKEIELIGSNASGDAWPDAVALVTHQKPSLRRLITHRFPAMAYADGIRMAREGQEAVKVVLEWGAAV